MESDNSSQQPAFVLPKQRFSTSLILVLTAVAFFFGYQNWQLKNNVNKLITSQEATEVELSWSIPDQASQSIQEITNQLLSNTLQLTSTTSGVPTFTKEFDLSQNNGWANYVITVYKYSPGTKVDMGYEGFSWTRNLDAEVKELRRLATTKNGMYINRIISINSGLQNGSVTIKDIGNQKYAIIDTYFPPSRSWHRKYQAYDPITNNIVEVTMGISPKQSTIQEKNICYEDKCAPFIIYPEEINNFFIELEGLMEE